MLCHLKTHNTYGLTVNNVVCMAGFFQNALQFDFWKFYCWRRRVSENL